MAKLKENQLYKKANIIAQLRHKFGSERIQPCDILNIEICTHNCALVESISCVDNCKLADKVENVKAAVHFQSVKSARSLIETLEEDL